MMNRILTLVIGLLITTLSFSQSKLNYDNDSRWFWTANVGAAWNTTDVTNKTAVGYGLTIGKSFNYNYSRLFSFDIRGRYLGGNWYGQDGDTTGFNPPNTALSSGTTNYQTSLGYSVLNNRTKVNELSLELVIHANSLRERTGFDLFVFGGAGYTWYQAKGDLTDTRAGGSLYAYDSLVNSNTLSTTSATGLRDNSYETALDGSSASAFTGAFMPSLGFGIGYQLGKRFSIGVEHKTTFTLTDNFDGYVNSTGKRANDLYHYTSGYLRFQIKDHVNYVEPIDNSVDNVNTYTAPTTQAPVVTFKNPASSGQIVHTPNYVIKANIQYVAGTTNVIFRQNGAYNTNFTFNPSSQSFESIVTLQSGQNVFELTGTNSVGSDQEQTIIIYNLDEQKPPIVTYVNPSTSPTTVQNATFNLTSTVLNVTQKSQITMQLNGQAFTNFTFNSSNNAITATLNLQNGTNIVTTTGTNTYGTDTESTALIFSAAQPIQPPVVYFVDPNVNPYTTAQSSFTINAEVLNVAGQQNITFKQNGSVNQNFVYNTQTKRLQSNVVLRPGQNVFEVVGVNAAGSAQASTIIVFNRPSTPKPPIVSFNNPSTNPTETSNPVYNLLATVLNVTQSNQIKVKLNETLLNNFGFNPSNGSVTVPLNLILGSNVVTVTGTNTDGTDSKQTTLIYRPTQAVQPPVVQFTAPSVDPFTTSEATFAVVSSVLNVPTRTGVSVSVNGVNYSAFGYANSNVTMTLNLIEGANVIAVTGTNTAGTDSETQTIIFRKPVAAQPPVISFVDPAVNPTTVYSPTYPVRARVRFVQNSNQIVLRINGQISTNFTYSNSNEIMEFTTGLVAGANTIQINATNTAGQDQESTTLIYLVPNPTIPPVVTISNPIAANSIVSSNTTPVTATILNVDGAANIQVVINGATSTNFSYNSTTKQLNLNMNLIIGSNSIAISGTNSAGTASDSRMITYKLEEQPVLPIVTFVNPSNPGTVVNTAGFTMRTRVQNVSGANQIVVILDGQNISPSLWNFNSTTQEVTFNTNLNVGNNIFTVTGTNTAGSNSASSTIIYQVPVVECDKPTIAFITPTGSGQEVSLDQAFISATINRVTSANQIQVIVNGILQNSGTYVAATKLFSKTVTLSVGQNVIEISATNSCGEVKSSITTIYTPVAAPCLAPVISRLLPNVNSLSVEIPTQSISASVVNVALASELSVTNNGVTVPFNFDVATHVVSLNVNLNEGINTVVVRAQTACGTSQLEWVITRNTCVPPTVLLKNSSVANGATTLAANIGIVADIAGVNSNSDITVLWNNQPIGFVFNAQSGILTLNQPLTLGQNTIKITVRNACGEQSISITVTQTQPQTQNPPTIQITNPGTTPYAISQPGMTVQIATTGVNNSNQVSVTINGNPINFNFNNASNSLSFNADFIAGSNVIVATAVNSAGTATDTKTVIYTQPVVVEPPVISITSPNTCPIGVPIGSLTVTGTVENVSNTSQVVITYNGVNINYTSSISNNQLSFSFDINITNVTVNLPIVITATNSAALRSKTCLVSLVRGNNGHGNNEDGNDESNPGQGGGGPTGEEGGSSDDENGNGGGKGGNGNSAPKPGGAGKPANTKPSTGNPTSTTGTRVVKPAPADTTKAKKPVVQPIKPIGRP